MPNKSKRKAAAFKQQAKNKAGPAASSGSQSASTAARKPSQDVLIIAIDFGTTYSGVAWHNTSNKKTHLIRDWPDQGISSVKVPSILRYDSKGRCQWGHVLNPTKRLEWFKLLLNEGVYTSSTALLHRIETKGLNGYPESRSTNLANLRTTIMAIPEGKTPADLAADFLRSLYRYTLETIGDSYFPELKEQLGKEGGVEIKCCLTVPAIWDDKAKNITKQAAIAAGMPEKHTYLISEPEAAAVHCLTQLEDVKGSLQVGHVYVIVDCGGGTVDLIPYEVTSIAPLRVRECAIGTGGLYGSTFINRRFEDLVIRRIGQEAYDNMDDHSRQVMHKEFDTEIKPKFHPDKYDDDDDDDDGPVTCALPGVPDDVERRVRKSKIIFSVEELREIFEPTFTDIAALVQKQVDAAQATTKRNVDGIIMVGGFGASQHLGNWLAANVRNKDGKAIKLIKSPEGAAAIVFGAVEHAVRMHNSGSSSSSQWGIVESRKARYHYGIEVVEPFRFGIHPQHKLVMDPIFGIPVCVGRMDWLISKGANMVQGEGITLEVRRRCPIVDSAEEQKELLVFDEEIYLSAEDAAPKDLEHPSIIKLLKYTTDLSGVPRRFFTKRPSLLGIDFWMIPSTIQLKLESADLTFTSLVRGSVYGEGKVEYHHKGPGRHGDESQVAAWRAGWTSGTVSILTEPEDHQGGQSGDRVLTDLAHLTLES
ncbi:hypothetical protein EV426DRAFT_613029 [Tirmania nivea]|nr:hypothetical protein EV426DRAFT_613029 [Tirmania nivea]